MTRFTSSLAIATVAFALVAGFGPGLMQPAFAGKAGGHEAAQHETNSTDTSGGTSSVDKGEKSGTSAGSSDKSGTETEVAEAANTETGDNSGDK